MLKSTLALAALAALLAITPAFAQDAMECNDANMMKMNTDMEAMTDPAKKEMVMKEMNMAKESMAANKMDDCKMHMDNAMKEMPKS